MIKIIGVFIVCIGAALAAAFGVFMLQDSPDFASPPAAGADRPDGAQSDVAEAQAQRVTALAKSAREMTEEERQTMIKEIRTQLETLMEEYDKHLKDREKRDELKQEIDLLVTQYNALILPVAISDVRKARVGSQ